MEFDEFCRNLVIIFVTFNRKGITEICLDQINKTRFGSTLAVYDDCSTDFDDKFLRSISTDAIIRRMKCSTGLGKIRFKAHNDFKNDFQFIYHTDNDAYHDPHWLHRLFTLHLKYGIPVSLFNDPYHLNCDNIIVNHDGVSIRRRCPGISFFYPLNCLDRVLFSKRYSVGRSGFKERPGWDIINSKALGRFAISEESFVEHYGADGVNTYSNYKCTAVNPTPWLQQGREAVLDSITNESRRKELIISHQWPQTTIPCFTN